MATASFQDIQATLERLVKEEIEYKLDSLEGSSFPKDSTAAGIYYHSHYKFIQVINKVGEALATGFDAEYQPIDVATSFRDFWNRYPDPTMKDR